MKLPLNFLIGDEDDLKVLICSNLGVIRGGITHRSLYEHHIGIGFSDIPFVAYFQFHLDLFESIHPLFLSLRMRRGDQLGAYP